MHPILADAQRLRLHLLAWILVGAMMGLLVRALLGTDWIASMLFALPMGIVAAPISLSAWYLCRAIPASRTGTMRLAGTAFIAALVTASVWAGLGRRWWDVLAWAGFALDEPRRRGLFALLVGLGALAYLVSVTAHYVMQAFEESTAAARRVLESQVAQRDAELRALRAQVDPHFLFNSLNSVAGLIEPHPDQARRMCQLLGDFLRDSLSLGRETRIPLGREVALARQYLGVEQVRYGHRLQVETDVAREAADVRVPPLLLQPLVENAVRHGIATLVDGGTVSIRARGSGARVVVTVTNPADADRRSSRGTGFGLDIVRRRLEASFADEAALVIESAGASYRVSLTIPVEQPA
jgi:two-component system sensor histidine kinase AlgZ